MEFFQSVLDLFANLQPVHYILLVLAGYIIESFFPPIPGDTILVFVTAFFSLNHDNINFIWLYISSVSGAVLGFMLMAYLGRHLGKQFFIEHHYAYGFSSFFKKAEQYFSRRGAKVILWHRLFFGMRPVIGLVAGMSNIRWYVTLGLVTLSAVIFNAAFMLLGYILGENWSLIESILRKYTVFTILISICVIVFIIWKWVKRKKKDTNSL